MSKVLLLVACFLAYVLIVTGIFVLGPDRALEHCLTKDGKVTTGRHRDPLCFDENGRLRMQTG